MKEPAQGAQVIVIGSGAGGATVALELASRGLDVLVLEEGCRVPVADYGGPATTAMPLLYRRRGMTPLRGSPPIAFVEGRCLGGSTEINSGFWRRVSAEALGHWREDFDFDVTGPEELAPHYEWAESLLGITLREGPPRRVSRLFREGAEALGWTAREMPRAAPGCRDTNTCAMGCPTGAKQGMSRSLIPRAEAAGARVLSDCRVVQITRRKGRATGVLVEHALPDGGREWLRLPADHVFCCAGPTGTPALLRRSGWRKNVGDTLRIHPMLKVVARFDEDVEASSSALPMYELADFWPEIFVGGSFFGPGHAATALAENWREVGDRLARPSHLASYYAAVRGSGEGKVRPALFGRGTLLSHRVSDEDVAGLSRGLSRVAELLLAAGAIEVLPAVRGLARIETPEQARRWLTEDLPRGALALTTVHAFSSCPAGERRDRCAVDSAGRVHGAENVFAADASTLPHSPGLNPQGTVMALAHRAAVRFAEEAMKGPLALVTGAPGWLGSRLVEVLRHGLPDVPDLAEGTDRRLRCLVQAGVDSSSVRALDAEVIEGDLASGEGLEAFTSDARDAVLFHCAGLIHPPAVLGPFGRTRRFGEVNVEGTNRLLEAARRAGVRRFVHVSSNSPLGCNPSIEHVFDEDSPHHPYMGYGRSKMEAELLVAAAQARGDFETVVIRPPWFYGPGQPLRQGRFFTMVAEGRFPIVGSGENRRSMAFVDNTCQGLLLCERREEAVGRTYWIADRRPYSMNEIVDTVERVLERDFGRKVSHRRTRLPWLAGQVAQWGDATLQTLGLYQQELHVMSEMNKTIACTIERAEAELGYAPTVELEEGMRASIQWMLDQGQEP